MSSVIGWAIGEDGELGLPAELGSILLPKNGLAGARFAAAEDAVYHLLETYKPNVMLVEAPLPIPALNSRAAALQQYFLHGMAQAEAWRASVGFEAVDSWTARWEVLGLARSVTSKVAKQKAFSFCQRLGWKPPGLDASDAGLLLAWRRLRLHPRQGRFAAA